MANLTQALLDSRFSPDVAHNPSLGRFLRRVYAKLAAGMILSAAVAWAIASQPQLQDLFFTTAQDVLVPTSLGMALIFSPLLVLTVGALAGGGRTKAGSRALYWSVVTLTGAALSSLVFIFTSANLISTFVIAAMAFLGLSAWGYFTRKNLGGLGTFLVFATFGLALALAIDLALPSPELDLSLDSIGVLLFAGLIASDTQQLRAIYFAAPPAGATDISSNYAALTLYLNTLNLFQFLLPFRRRRG